MDDINEIAQAHLEGTTAYEMDQVKESMRRLALAAMLPMKEAVEQFMSRAGPSSWQRTIDEIKTYCDTRCPMCDGTGQEPTIRNRQVVCYDCDGTGKRIECLK